MRAQNRVWQAGDFREQEDVMKDGAHAAGARF